MKRFVTNIGLLAGVGHDGKRCLKGKEMGQLNTIANAYLAIEDGRFSDYGEMTACPSPTGEVVPYFRHGATPIRILFMRAVVSRNL